MHEVAGEESAQRACILARATASAIVREKTDAVEMGERSRRVRSVNVTVTDRCVERLAIRMTPDHFAHCQAVSFRRAVPQLAIECFLQRAHIPVLTEHQREHEPQVSRADAAIGTVIALEGAVGKARDVRCTPRPRNGGCQVNRCVVMAHVGGRERAAARDRLGRATDQHTVHDDRVTHRNIAQQDLVLGLDRCDERDAATLIRNRFTGRKIGERHDDSVIGVNEERAARRHGETLSEGRWASKRRARDGGSERGSALSQ